MLCPSSITGGVESGVVLISDHPLTRYAFKRLIKDHTSLRVAAQLTSSELEPLSEPPLARLIVLEVSAAGEREQNLVRRLREWLPGGRILVLLRSIDAQSVKALVAAGAASVWTTSSTLSVLLQAIHQTIEGRRWIDPACLEASESPRSSKSTLSAAQVARTGSASLLSYRELQILTLIRQGYSNQQIAASLFLSVHTVKHHMTRIMFKLSATNRTQAVLKAIQSGIELVGS